MGEIAKQGSRNTVILYFGAVLGALNNILIYPNVLPKEQVGLITLLGSISFMVASLSSFGATVTVVRFIPRIRLENPGVKVNKGALGYLLRLCAVIGFFIGGLLLVFQGQVEELYADNAELLNEYYWYIIPLFLLDLFINVLSNYSNAIFKTTFQMFVKDVFVRVGQVFLLLGYYFSWIDLQGFVAGYVLIFCLALLSLVFYLVKIGELSFEYSPIDPKLKKEMFKYSKFSFLTSAIRTIGFRIDALMISLMVVGVATANGGLDAVAIYTRALFMAAMIEMPFRAFGQIVSPSISKAWGRSDMKEIKNIYSKTTDMMVILGVLSYCMILISVRDVEQLLPPDFNGVAKVFVFLGLGKLINVSFGVNGLVLSNSPKYRYLTWFSVVTLIITVITNWLFIKSYGISGAALATFITYLIVNVLISVYLYKQYKIRPFNLSNFYTLLVGFVLTLILVNVDIGNPILNGLVKSTLFILIFVVSCYKLNLSIDFNVAIDKLYLRLRTKK